MKTWTTLLFSLLLTACGTSSSTLTEAGFTAYYRDSLEQAFPEAQHTILSDLEIKSVFRETEQHHFLDNAYSEYNLNHDSLHEIISKYVHASVAPLSPDLTTIIERIVPLVKPVEFLHELLEVLELEEYSEIPLVFEEYNNRLIVIYAEDHENNIKYLVKDEFELLNLNRDSLRELAVTNLLRILPEIERVGNERTFALMVGGDYEASLILDESLWREYLPAVDGEYVIAIPSRDLLLVTGSQDSSGISLIRELVKKSHGTGDHPISPFLFKWNGEKFEEYR